MPTVRSEETGSPSFAEHPNSQLDPLTNISAVSCGRRSGLTIFPCLLRSAMIGEARASTTLVAIEWIGEGWRGVEGRAGVAIAGKL